MKYTDNGNLIIGILCALTIYNINHQGLDIGAGIERGLIAAETDLIIEIGYDYGF